MLARRMAMGKLVFDTYSPLIAISVGTCLILFWRSLGLRAARFQDELRKSFGSKPKYVESQLRAFQIMTLLGGCGFVASGIWEFFRS
jgi:hypothetical protein